MSHSSIRSYISRLLFLPAIILSFTQESLAAPGWYTEWDSAVSMAQKCALPLVVVFEHEGCGECLRMGESLAAQSSQNALENAVKVRLECDRNAKLVSRYDVSLTPTFLVFNLEGGRLSEVYREVGFMSPSRIAQVGQSVDKLAARLARQIESTTPAVDAPVSDRKVAGASSVRKSAPARKTTTTRKPTRKKSAAKPGPAAQQPQYAAPQGYGGSVSNYEQEAPRRRLWPFR